MLRKCPKPESLLELISIPREMTLGKKLSTRCHALFCHSCQEKIQTLRKAWNSYSPPEPDINDSLLNVYNRLQNDETLILKGWKLGRAHHHASSPIWDRVFKEGWFFRGALSAAVASVLVFVLYTTWQPNRVAPQKTTTAFQEVREEVPFVQYRYKDKNRVQVHYVQPELLQTIEFETASAE